MNPTHSEFRSVSEIEFSTVRASARNFYYRWSPNWTVRELLVCLCVVNKSNNNPRPRSITAYMKVFNASCKSKCTAPASSRVLYFFWSADGGWISTAFTARKSAKVRDERAGPSTFTRHDQDSRTLANLHFSIVITHVNYFFSLEAGASFTRQHS